MKPFKQKLHHAINASITSLGERMHLRRLPTLLNGHLTTLPTGVWKDVLHREERYTTNVLAQHLRAGDCFWDVGAHHGLMSLQASWMVGSQGHVVCVEPEPENCKRIARTLEKFPNYQLFQAGAGASLSEKTFFSHGSVTYGSFVNGVTDLNRNFGSDEEIQAISRQIITLDAIRERTQRWPNLIKIDVEGFEIEVLKGASALLEKGISAWFIEVHPLQIEMNGQKPIEVEELLKKHGYLPKEIERHGALYTLFAPAPRAGNR